MWFGRGFVVALAVLLGLRAGVAFAQTSFETTITSPAIPTDPRPRTAVPTEIRGSQDFPLQSATGVASGAASSAGNGSAATIVLPSTTRDSLRSGRGRGSGGARPGSGFDPILPDRSGARRAGAQQDGDLTPNIAPPPQDGIITVGEPQGLLDGEDPTKVDGRAPEDIAAFNAPPAGYDPAAFDLEISPALDRRPGQLFRFEPYQAIGIRIGSFVLFPQVETALAHTNNVFSSPRGRSDTALEVAPGLRLVSNWKVHALELNASGRTSFHRNFTTENERSYQLDARGRLDITRRTNIEGLARRAVSQESRSGANSTLSAGQNRTDIVTDTLALTGNHRFNRLSLQLRGAVQQINYAPAEVNIAAPPAPPVFARVDERDYRTRDLGLRTSWEFKPTLTVFADLRLRQRIYDRLQGGVNRDSSGKQWRAGVSFGTSGAYLRGEISAGYGNRRPDQRSLAPIDAFLFDANLAWRMNALTSLLFTANTDFTETTLAGASAGLTRTAGISVRHSFRRNLIGTVGINHSRVSYQGAGVSEATTTASAGLEYSINRTVQLFGSYNHSVFNSNQPGSDYRGDDIRIGMRLRR